MDYQDIDRTVKDMGYQLPCKATNDKDEIMIVEKGVDKHRQKFYKIRTVQKNKWIRTDIYYEDGSHDELYDRSYVR